MFYDKDIEKFRSITAPEGLKEKIEKELYLTEKKKNGTAKQILSLAACFAVVFSFLLFSNLSASEPALMFNGTEIRNKAVCLDGAPPSVARAAISSGMPFELKVKEKTTLSVSDGGLLKEGKTERTETLVLSEKGKTKVYVVFEDEFLPVTLTAETEKEKAVYILCRDETKGYIIYQDALIKK